MIGGIDVEEYRQTQSLEQLTDAVSQLTLAAAASERRRMALSRRLRWALALAVVLTAGAVFRSESVIPAYAAGSGASGQEGSREGLACQIEPITMFFRMMNGLMGGMMQSEDVERYMYWT